MTDKDENEKAKGEKSRSESEVTYSSIESPVNQNRSKRIDKKAARRDARQVLSMSLALEKREKNLECFKSINV